MKKSLLIFLLAFAFVKQASSQCSTGSAPTNNCNYGDGFQSFQLNSISAVGNSGCGANGYNSFSAPIWTLTLGSSYSWNASVGSGYYPEGVGIWIDLNNDGNYATTEFVSSGAPSTFVSGVLTIPYTGVTGVNLRMRIRDAYSSSVTNGQACTNGIGFGYGETEDYYVYLVCPASIPAPTVAASGTLFCSGATATLTASGLSTYTWSGGVTNGVGFTTNTTTTVYTVTAGISSCPTLTSSAVKSISVNATPTVVLSPTSASICPAGSFVITPSGATTYTYNGGSGTTTGASSTVSPIVNTTYTVSGTTNSCIGTSTMQIVTLSSPTIVISATTPSVCPSINNTISATGANTYTWTSPATIASSIVVNPTTTTIYTVTGTGTTVCNGVKTYTLTVYTTPTITVNSGTICTGYNFTVSPGGASTYTIMNSTGTVNTVVNPLASANYSVTGTSALGCVSTLTAPAVSSVAVIPSPTITATSGTVCLNSTFTVAPTGASTYSFNGASTTSAGLVSPAVTTSYSITGTGTNGCVTPTFVVASVSVVPLPTVTAVSSASAVCIGQSTAVITASGASSYSWNTSASTTTIAASPTTTTLYSVIGTSSLLCSSTAYIAILVNPLPVVTAVANNTFICVGGSSTLSASGANTYSWVGVGGTASVTVSPSVNTTYSCVGTSAAGCKSSATASITVNNITMTVTPNSTVCIGSGINLTATGAITYMWNNNFPFQTLLATPTVPTVYTVTGVDINNCSTTQTVSVGVFTVPTVAASISNTRICVTESATLTATGSAGSNYSWSNGSSGASVIVTPSVAIPFGYTVTATNSNSCTATSTISLLVSGCTGINEANADLSGISVYPNPNNGEFTVELSDNQVKAIEVVDVTGRVVLNGKRSSDKVNFNLSTFANCIYYVRVISDNATKVVKVVKQ